MALTYPLIFASLQACRMSGGIPLSGSDFDRLASGIAQGIVQWGVGQQQNLALTGVAVGSGGFGVINPPATKVIVAPNSGTLITALNGAGIKGMSSTSLAVAVANGISMAFSAYGQYSGVSSTVGVGSDTSRITVANATTLIGIFKGTLGAGLSIEMLSIGFGNGIATMLLQGTGLGSVSGIPTPYAASGMTVSMMV